MEYALKSAGYSIGDECRVDPDWDRFANEIDDLFLKLTDTDTTSSKDYLLTSPPKKQVLTASGLTFIDRSIDKNQKSTQQLLLMVRGVRNNLFHGGKYHPDAESEPGRNERLVRYSLNVLLACSLLCGNVKDYFEK